MEGQSHQQSVILHNNRCYLLELQPHQHLQEIYYTHLISNKEIKAMLLQSNLNIVKIDVLYGKHIVER